MITLFLELAGPQAQAVLTKVATRLKADPACYTLRLLESAEQEGLFLLVLEWGNEALPELPEEVKVWKFKALRTDVQEV